MEKERYPQLAIIYYDLGLPAQDIGFYLKYAKKAKEVLELGAGTGRVTIPMLKAGIKVTAVEKSATMMKRLQEKTKGMKGITYIHGDLTQLKLNKKFELIVMPYRVWQCLLTVKEQKQALTVVKQHLTPQGLFIFDTFIPDFKILGAIPTTEKKAASFKVGSRTIHKTYEQIAIEPERQIVTTIIRYYEGKKLKVEYPLKMCYSFKAELEHLLELSGFKIKKLLTTKKEMFFVCKKI